MSEEPLDTLLAKLNEGDPAAAEDVFREYEPYLRMVIRRRLSQGLRAKFDSMDIVQSAWADLLDGFREAKWSFQDADQLRAFLVRVTRNRFIDRMRQHREALKRELPLSPGAVDALPLDVSARVSEVVRADELWGQMLDACPPAHYELLNLKRQGKSLAEIAAHTRLHQSSVRRILYDIARRVALRQDASNSSR